MKQRRRIYYSSEQRNLMWDRWQKATRICIFAHRRWWNRSADFSPLKVVVKDVLANSCSDFRRRSHVSFVHYNYVIKWTE